MRNISISTAILIQDRNFPVNTTLLCRFACRPFPSPAVWGGQTDGQPGFVGYFCLEGESPPWPYSRNFCLCDRLPLCSTLLCGILFRTLGGEFFGGIGAFFERTGLIFPGADDGNDMVNRYHGTLTPPRNAPSRLFREKAEVSLYPASASSQAAATTWFAQQIRLL